MSLTSKIWITILSLTALCLIIFFSLSLFTNIQYPLMWGDEAETAVFSSRILKFGYPKVHDGKNVMNFLLQTDKSVGIKQKYDVYVGLPWLQYYFGTLGVKLSQSASGLYKQTGLIRIPFAAIGLLGVILFPLIIVGLCSGWVKKLIVVNIFLLLELISIPLVLHLREVRSYSITVFLYALMLIVVSNYLIIKKIPYWLYFILATLIPLLILNNFTPAFPPLALSLFIYLAFYWVGGKSFPMESGWGRLFGNGKALFGSYLKALLPLIVSGVLAIPVILFFNMLQNAAGVSQSIGFSTGVYFGYLKRIILFFLNYDNLILLLFILLVLAYLLQKAITRDKLVKDNLVYPLVHILNYLLILFIVYILVVARVPGLFDRYYIVLQPISSLIIVLALFTIYKLISINYVSKESKSWRELFIYLLLPVVFANYLGKISLIKGHVYELTHRYQGPLDFIIPYLQKIYKDPSQLIIEASHEQISYMYYLNSRVIYDYNPLSSENTLAVIPDVIVPVNYMVPEEFSVKVDKLLKENKYRKVSFPIYDYPANNIPELSISLRHLFKTKLPEKESDQVYIYLNEATLNK